MSERAHILFVDDDAELLAAFMRRYRTRYRVDLAVGPVRALESVTEKGPYAVVVSDLRLPGLDGVAFLDRLKRVCPDTVRIMLTGHADLSAAVSAVNTGQVFRFLIKPCPEEDLDAAVAAAAVTYAQVSAEKDFLKGALRGIIKVLADLLALQNPEAMSRATRIRRLVADMARYLEASDAWRVDLAVTLSQLGAVVMPEFLFTKLRDRGELDGDQARLFGRHPAIGADLLGNIPRLREVSDIIRLQHARYDGAGRAPGDPVGTDIPLGARLLKLTLDYDTLLTSGHNRDQALAELAGRGGQYDPRLLELLGQLAGSFEGYARAERTVGTLGPGMVLEEPIRLRTGELAATVGQVVDHGLLERLVGLDLDRNARVRARVPATEESSPTLADPELLALLRKVKNCPPGA
jgi:response regulator RpfG family c-di-GMP phosphodiesterase